MTETELRVAADTTVGSGDFLVEKSDLSGWCGGLWKVLSVLSGEDMAELIRVFMPQCSRRARLIDQIETHMNRVVELGFLYKLKAVFGQSASYQARQILKVLRDSRYGAHLRLGQQYIEFVLLSACLAARDTVKTDGACREIGR